MMSGIRMVAARLRKGSAARHPDGAWRVVGGGVGGLGGGGGGIGAGAGGAVAR